MFIGFVLLIMSLIFLVVFVVALAPPTQLVAKWSGKNSTDEPR